MSIHDHSILAVLAHPDDESLACGGLLAKCATSGARVSLFCATHGDCGGLGDVRVRELKAATRLLGVSKVMLLDHADGELTWAETLEADIRSAIHRLRPDVVVTFGEDGLYWHPDHIAVHEKTTAAVASLGASAPALYYVTMPPGVMRAVAATVGGATPSPRVLGIDADAFGALAAQPTLVVDVGPLAVRKLAALKCHRTQLRQDPLDRLGDDEAVRLLAVEHYRRADVGARTSTFLDKWGRESFLEGPHREKDSGVL